MRFTFIPWGIRGATRAIPVLPVLLALSALSAPVQADSTIGAPSGGIPVGFWGPGSIPTFGQSITAPTGEDFLTSFTLNFDRLQFGNGGQTYNAYVYNWNGTTVTGSALFTSAALTAPNGGEAVTISTGTLAVTGGQQYALLFSTLAQPSSGDAYSFARSPNGATYAGGSFIANFTTSLDGLTTEPWNNDANAGDLTFTATFTANAAPPSTAAPEPGSLALLLPVVGVAGMVIRKRRGK